MANSAEPPRPYRPKPADEIRRNMSAIRSKNTRAEIRLRSELHRLGLRFRIHRTDLPGRPDIVFPKARFAIFVDGDFWHARLLKERGHAYFANSLRTPKRDYWIGKFTRRVQRDVEVIEALREIGWKAARFWESEVLADPQAVALRIRDLLTPHTEGARR